MQLRAFDQSYGVVFPGIELQINSYVLTNKNHLPYLCNGLYVWSNRNDLFWDIVDLSLLFGVGGKKSEVHFSEGIETAGLTWLDPKIPIWKPVWKKRKLQEEFICKHQKWVHFQENCLLERKLFITMSMTHSCKICKKDEGKIRQKDLHKLFKIWWNAMCHFFLFCREPFVQFFLTNVNLRRLMARYHVHLGANVFWSQKV